MECITVSIGGRSSSVRVEGPTGGPVVLCLHGLSLHAGLYADAAAALAPKGYRVIALDFFGRGKSPWPYSGDADASFYVDQCVETLKALGVSKVALVTGHSLGGGVAVALASRHPDLVERVLPTCPVGLPGGSTFVFGYQLWAILKLPLAVSSRLVSWMGMAAQIADGQRGDFLDGEKHAAKMEEQVQLVRDNLAADEAGFLTSWLSTLRSFPLGNGSPVGSLGEDFARLAARPGSQVLFMWGEGDSTCAIDLEQQATLRRLVPNAELRIVSGTAHGLLYEEAGQVHAAMAEMLS